MRRMRGVLDMGRGVFCGFRILGGGIYRGL